MTTIRLEFEKVMKELSEIEKTLSTINISSPQLSHLGNNQLDFTKAWLEREIKIEQLLTEYIQVVQKNVEDTKANIRLLKEQDEANVRN